MENFISNAHNSHQIVLKGQIHTFNMQAPIFDNSCIYSIAPHIKNPSKVFYGNKSNYFVIIFALINSHLRDLQN